MRARRALFRACAPARAAPLLRLRVEADAGAIRGALTEVRAALGCLEPSDECLGDIELVLAELLNNIHRHAYAGGPGRIELSLALGQGDLICTLIDQGGPMPGGELPAGQAVPVDLPCAALPEGGFGWFLIRSHAVALDYSRKGGVNCLTLRLPLTRTG